MLKHFVILVFVAMMAGGCATTPTRSVRPDASEVDIKTKEVVYVPHNNGVTTNTVNAALDLTGGQAFTPEQAIEVLGVNNKRIEIETDAAVKIQKEALKVAAANKRAYDKLLRDKAREKARIERGIQQARDRRREQRLDATENISRELIRGFQRARSNR